MKSRVKYLIVGQGLVGTWMSYYLESEGISFVVVNDPNTIAATSVASGVINPVTGRRIVQTWLIEEILPFSVQAYQQLATKLQTHLIQEAPVIMIHPSAQMQESFEYRLTHENVYLSQNKKEDWDTFFNIHFGTGQINTCFWIDLNTMLEKWRSYLLSNNKFIADRLEEKDIHFKNNKVQWKNCEADYIIFCDGNNSRQYRFFETLPFAPNKGEALIVEIKGLPKQHIYKNNISIVPWKEDLFWVGSNYEWQFDAVTPSESFKTKMITSLNQLLKIPFVIKDHIVGVRPANRERRPFVGLHPRYPQIGICNGMGTKGCSLAPYFSKQLIDHIESGKSIHPEADVQRFDFN